MTRVTRVALVALPASRPASTLVSSLEQPAERYLTVTVSATTALVGSSLQPALAIARGFHLPTFTIQRHRHRHPTLSAPLFPQAHDSVTFAQPRSWGTPSPSSISPDKEPPESSNLLRDSHNQPSAHRPTRTAVSSPHPPNLPASRTPPWIGQVLHTESCLAFPHRALKIGIYLNLDGV